MTALDPARFDDLAKHLVSNRPCIWCEHQEGWHVPPWMGDTTCNHGAAGPDACVCPAFEAAPE